MGTGVINLAADLLGTFVFALSGAAAGAQRRLDLFGILVLAFVAGNFGGITRDVLIGALPPNALADPRYVLTSALAGLAVFWFFGLVSRLRSPVMLFDAAGLALFAVAGAQKALQYGLNPLAAAILGMLSGIGGGMTRDLLINEIPGVLRSDLYAVAALAGAGVVVAGHALELPGLPVAITGAAVCFGLRFMAIRRGWRLPTLRRAEASDDRPVQGRKP